MHSKVIGFLTIVLSLSLLNAQNSKRRPVAEDSDRLDKPLFQYEISTYPSENRDSVTVRVKTKVSYDVLQFIKDGNIFTAEYELSIIIIDDKEKKSVSDISDHKLTTEIFGETNSQRLFDINEFSFRLLPDKYTVIISIMDKDTKKRDIQKKIIETGNFYEKSVSISNINIIDQKFKTRKGNTHEISSIDGSISDMKPDFTISYNVLSDGGPAKITYRILTIDGKEVKSETVADTLPEGICTRQYSIDRKDLSYTKYKIEVEIQIGTEKISQERMFQLRWLGMSQMIDDLDIAIEQLKYITGSRDIRKLKKASEKEKKEKFIGFWKKLDPTPASEENELMNEYYRRVRYANANFSGFMEGWKTDMGMIFILFGPPNDIERHPYESESKPYEIWYYYEIDRTFIFVDETGFGDYRLTEPYYDNVLHY